MTNEEFCKAHIGERVLYKGKDIGAYVAGYVEEKYIILGSMITKDVFSLLIQM